MKLSDWHIFAYFGVFLLLLPMALANTYIADIGFVTSQTVYTTNETIELKGNLYLSNYSSNGTLVTNHTGVENATINISVINKNTNATSSSYNLNTTTSGAFYSRSNFYPAAVLITAPSAADNYYIKARYVDTAGATWWTQSEIQVINQTVDRLEVSPDKVAYSPSETMFILVEAITEIGDRITYTANVSVNGSLRNSAKTVLSTFNCTTSSSGKCMVTATAPGSYGDYYVEVNNFKAFGSFKVKRFDVNIVMKDELGESIKHIFATGEQASVEINVITNSTSENYTFDGTVKDSSGSVIKNITSTALNSNNSYTNRFTFTLDALSFQVGTYSVEVNVTKTGDGTVGTSTSFEVKSWDLLLKKKDVNSGFEYEYSAFPNRTVNLEIYPTWRANGSIIDNINATTSINISMVDKMNNQLATYNSTWNASCGKGGCYAFSLATPVNGGEYYVVAAVSNSGATQTLKKGINVITTSIFAQSTDKDGALKDLFGADDYAYITLSAKNTTASVNLTSASIVSITYMNGTEYTYVQVSDFGSVNNTNGNREWAWNITQQRLKLDTPSMGGIYTVYITAENNTAATSTKFIVNPYDVCLVAKNTAGQAGGSSGYYYVYQFKTSDTVYFELKVTQANNPTGRAAFFNSTNSSYGMGSACADQSSTKQAVNNATITIEGVTNTQTGKTFALNTTASGCQADDNKGAYTCTIKPLANWDGGSYGIRFRMVGLNGQTDIAYGGFDARAFYLYAWSSSWQNKPASNIPLNVYMYEAGDNWWGSYGSGGLSGTVKLEKVEYQGRDGEWLWPPIVYGYNTSQVNTSTVTNGQGTITLSANHTTEGSWKTGYYRAVLKGTDSGGTSDYGYAWFSIRQWEVYASPVDCSGGTCTSTYNINSRNNVSLYVTINNAGEWGQGGRSLGGNVIVSVKKLQDCRRWPCTDLNSSSYNATSINVSTTSSWYWSGSIDTRYIINITPISGTWGTGYRQVVLDINGTETGSGWFNTIAFYAEAQPTDVTGNNWKYSIKNPEPMYFKVKTTKSQKSGYYYATYLYGDYLNTTIDDAVLRMWDQTTYQQIEYNYPENFNITIVGGGTIINETKILNVTYNNGSWPSGYYNGELTFRNSDNETATAWLWFQARPFRVQISSSAYSIDNNVCVNGTMYIYDPDWWSSTVLSGTYNITSVTETVWTGYGSSITTYTNFTPSGNFNGSANFTICPNSARWGSGSWGNYHYLTVKVQNNQSSSESGWLSFRTVPFSISWGSIAGGTNVLKASNVVVPITLTRASTGALASGNLSKIYQWRSDIRGGREEYVFSVGSCYSNVSGSCMINGTRNVTIYAPGTEWKDGYNYLQAEWFEYDDASSKVQDYSGIWFNGKAAYSGWFYNSDENGYWKYNFATNDNLTIRMYVRDTSSNAARVNITRVEYSTPSTSCWDEYCRIYNNAAFTIVGRSNNEINDNGIIKIVNQSANWTRGNIYFRVTVNGGGGTATIKNGNVFVKDFVTPTVNVTAPSINTTLSASAFWINWTTSEAATCSLSGWNHDYYSNTFCANWNASGNSTNTTVNTVWVDVCNATKYGFNGSLYNSWWVSRDYRSWNNISSGSYSSGSTGLITGGTNHYYYFNTNQFSISGLPNQDYGVRVYCNDEDWNVGLGYAVLRINVTAASVNQSNVTSINVTLVSPANGTTVSASNVTFNYTLTGLTGANCSLYGNFSGTWALNTTSSNVSAGSRVFGLNLSGGRYMWNVYCANATNSTWGTANWTFTLNTALNVTLVSPANGTGSSSSNVTFNYTLGGLATVNCSLYGNFSGTWASNMTSNNIVANSNNATAFSRNFSLNLTNGVYLWNVYCVNAANGALYDWGDANWTFTVSVNTTDATNATAINVTLVSPANGTTTTNASVTFNYTLSGLASANCSLYGNFSGTWALNMTSSNITAGSKNFSRSLNNGTYVWNVYCANATNSAQYNWSAANWTFTVNTANATQQNISVTGSSDSNSTSEWLMFGRTLNHTRYYPGNVSTTISILWNFTRGDEIYSSPAVAGGVVYIGSRDNRIYALNASSGSHIWNFTTGGDVDSSPAVAGGVVYFGSMDNKVYALNASSGSHIWNFTTGSWAYSSPAVASGILYIGSLDRKIYALNASNGNHMWNYTTGGAGDEIYSSPAVASGIVYIGSLDNRIYALNASNGSQIWNYTTGGDVDSSPAVAGGVVYIGSLDNKTYALNASSGAHIWNYTMGNNTDYSSSPAVANGVVYVGNADNKVYALNASSGSHMWNYTTGNQIKSSPAVATNLVFFGSMDNRIYALNVSNGAHIWNYTTGNSVRSSPAVANGIVYIGSSDNRTYAFSGS